MKPLSRKEIREEINSFNNAVAGRVEGWWMYFRASGFAVKGIQRVLERKIEWVGGDEYRIYLSNRNPLKLCS